MKQQELSRALGRLYNAPGITEKQQEAAYALYVCVSYNHVESGLAENDPLKVTRRHDGRLTTTSFKKWVEWTVRHCGRLKDYATTEQVLEHLPWMATTWGELFRPKSYTFEVVSGQAIVEAYVHGPKSCMSGDENRGQTQFYADNANVSLVKIHEDGTYMGRALLWTLENGNRFLDRVYPSDGGAHTQAVREWAKDQGWMVRTRDNASDRSLENGTEADLRVVVDTFTARRTPYLDTLLYVVADESGKLVLVSPENPAQGVWKGQLEFWNSQDGSSYRAWEIEGLFGRKGNMWEFVSTLEGYVHKDDLFRLKQYGEQWGLERNEIHCGVSGRKTHAALMRSIYVGNWNLLVHPDEVMTDEELHPHLGYRQVLRRDAVQVTAGLSAGFWLPAQSITEVDGERWCSLEHQEYSNILNVQAAYVQVRHRTQKKYLELWSTSNSPRVPAEMDRTLVLSDGTPVPFQHYSRDRIYKLPVSLVPTLHAALCAQSSPQAQAAD